MLKAVSITIEDERDQLRFGFKNSAPSPRPRCWFSQSADVVDHMSWEDLLLVEGMIECCAFDARTTALEILDAVREFCRPTNDDAFRWMRHYHCLTVRLSPSVLLEVEHEATTRAAERAFIKQRDLSSKGGERKNAEHSRRAGAIENIWASGKYATRDRCAEEEWEALGFAKESTARRHLQGTRDPDPWPGRDQ